MSWRNYKMKKTNRKIEKEVVNKEVEKEAERLIALIDKVTFDTETIEWKACKKEVQAASQEVKDRLLEVAELWS